MESYTKPCLEIEMTGFNVKEDITIAEMTRRHRFIVALHTLSRAENLFAKAVRFDALARKGEIEYYDTEDILNSIVKLKHEKEMTIEFTDGQGVCFKKFKFIGVRFVTHEFIADYTDNDICTHKLDFGFDAVESFNCQTTLGDL